MLDVCVFGSNNYNLNSLMNIQNLENDLLQFNESIVNFPKENADASTKGIIDYND